MDISDNQCRHVNDTTLNISVRPLSGIKFDPTLRVINMPHQVDQVDKIPLTDIIAMNLRYKLLSL